MIEEKKEYTYEQEDFLRRVLDNTIDDPFVAQSKDFVIDSDFLELYFADSEKKRTCLPK